MSFLAKTIRTIRRATGIPYFATRDVKIGDGVKIGRNVRFECQTVRIGDGTVIQDNVRIHADSFEIGDYGTIYFGSFFPGPGRITIGHNFWLGNNCVVDSQGGTTIDDNVGVGAHSQLWTHMKFGDVMAGCRFHSEKPLHIEKDAWLVGHNLVSPVHIGERALVMLGSLVTKDVPADSIFAGVPAVNITERAGSQFRATTLAEREGYLSRQIEQFAKRKGIENIWSRISITDSEKSADSDNGICLNLATRTYNKKGTKLERELIRFLLPDTKFTPRQN